MEELGGYAVLPGETSGLVGYPVVPEEPLSRVLIHAGWEQRQLHTCLLDCGSAFAKHRERAGWSWTLTRQHGTRLNSFASLDYATHSLSF